nr:MAG TPA: hypothetical protein [Crassvirales sp.]
METKRSVKKSFISPSLSPAIWVMVFFSINSSQRKQVSCVCVFIYSQYFIYPCFVPANFSCSSVAHMLFTQC